MHTYIQIGVHVWQALLHVLYVAYVLYVHFARTMLFYVHCAHAYTLPTVCIILVTYLYTI